jgi:hypothetical protein
MIREKRRRGRKREGEEEVCHCVVGTIIGLEAGSPKLEVEVAVVIMISTSPLIGVNRVIGTRILLCCLG